VRTEAPGHEQLTRHATDRSQDALVVDTSASELALDHLRRAPAASTGELTSPAFEDRRNVRPDGRACERQHRQEDSEDVADDRDQRKEADDGAESADVGADPEPGRAAPQRSDDDCRGGQGTDDASDGTRHGLRRVADVQPDRTADDRTDDRRGADAEDVRPQDPRDRHGQAQAEPETEADRVPAPHAAECRER
jgi:hypothetical protein